ncbi:hypothetical protein B0T26DRAFT_754554 [Lasiosphaeria miniovina]|uniref:Uncharacterized protein n=1 Tax=Lasiosphaeria miniovina TaxID=1954250 RepID=A0AA40DN60_9PEZI|nr:uncharacterized protein B0T26DRAFT_754554 [Lasiosphaeria miniovina]KAK0709325.1 hypothetical protein B0T26DRAFT_754554 [Lasiosphaeria miniovina]
MDHVAIAAWIATGVRASFIFAIGNCWWQRRVWKKKDKKAAEDLERAAGDLEAALAAGAAYREEEMQMRGLAGGENDPRGVEVATYIDRNVVRRGPNRSDPLPE